MAVNRGETNADKRSAANTAVILVWIAAAAAVGCEFWLRFVRYPVFFKMADQPGNIIMEDRELHLLDALSVQIVMGSVLITLFGASVAYLLNKVGGNRYAVAWFLIFCVAAYVQYALRSMIGDVVVAEQPSYAMLKTTMRETAPGLFLPLGVVAAFGAWYVWAKPKFKLR